MSLPLLLALTLVAAPPEGSRTVDAGPLQLSIVISESAQLFHIVDQLSRWSPYCHPQYRRILEAAQGGGLSATDEALLAEHAALRKRLGYGVLDRTFYREGRWQEALESAVKAGELEATSADTERRVLQQFEERLRRFIAAESESTEAGARGLLAAQPQLRAFAERASRFWGGGKVQLPLYLVASPPGRGGGGFNGGKLVVEVGARSPVPVDTAIHEAWHAFAEPHREALRAAASAAGTDQTTLSEGLAYGVSPGLYPPEGAPNALVATVAQDLEARRSFLNEPYVRFNRLGLALRPLMREALEAGTTYAELLPKAGLVYRALAEVAAAETHGASSRKPSYFFFGPTENFPLLMKAIDPRGRNVWGRPLVEKDLVALREKMKPADIVALVALRSDLLNAPEAFQATWGPQWTDLRRQLEKTPRGQLRVQTDAGPRVAVWSEDPEALKEQLATDSFRKLLEGAATPAP